jgi:hypothetical protein
MMQDTVIHKDMSEDPDAGPVDAESGPASAEDESDREHRF